AALGVGAAIPEKWRKATVSSTPPSEIPSRDEIPKMVWTMPVAKPRYSRGTEPRIAAWFGVLKKPDPTPTRAIMVAGRSQGESTRRKSPIAKARIVARTPGGGGAG